jgi:hypothetical protein
MSPVKYELGYYISEDCVIHSHGRETVRSYMEIDFFLLLFLFASETLIHVVA